MFVYIYILCIIIGRDTELTTHTIVCQVLNMLVQNPFVGYEHVLEHHLCEAKGDRLLFYNKVSPF